MKLLIDIGNTSAKIAVADMSGGEIRFVHHERKAESWGELLTRITSQYPIDSCALSSVAAPDAELDAALAQMPFGTRTIAWDTPCPVKPLVGIMQGYGADRLAADIGAVSQDPDHTVLIVDAGTCVTYDLFSAEGKLLGGCIAPGVALKLRAMHEHTAALPLIDIDGELPPIGYNTDTALRCGAVLGTQYEIEGHVRHLSRLYPDLHVFVTGGNDFAFSADVQERITHDPDLLLKGLCMI